MKVYVYILLTVAALAACQSAPDSKVQESVSGEDLEDEMAFADSLDVVDNSATYLTDDGLFDDFIYRFMQDSVLQFQRISFPLTCKVDGRQKKKQRDEWKYDCIYPATSDYSAIYDGQGAAEHTCDSALRKATVEIVDLKQNRIKMYDFKREGLFWMLKSIDEHFFKQDNNHGFLMFYSQFVNNEEFQQEHVHDPFFFKTYDSDNFQEIEGWVSAELWPDYRIALPSEQLFNIIYDDKRPTSSYRTFVVGSPSSGMECTLLFKQSGGVWRLVRMEN